MYARMRSLGGAATSLIGPAINTARGFWAPRVTVYAYTPTPAANGIITSHQSPEQNAASLAARNVGEGFSGIYSPTTGTLEARLSGEVPGALVTRNGGHRAINRESSGSADDTVAFTAIITEDGPMRLGDPRASTPGISEK